MEQGRTDREASVADGDVVVLVSEAGEPTGTAPKLTAHVPPGRLHLAFSVVLYRIDGPVLLQQRAGTKYHFPLAWANSCCSHPRPGEDIVDSAERRVAEELGLCCRLTEVGTLTYRAVVPGLRACRARVRPRPRRKVVGEPVPDPTEVAALRWDVPGEVLVPAANSAPWLVPVLRLAERARAAGLAPPG